MKWMNELLQLTRAYIIEVISCHTPRFSSDGNWRRCSVQIKRNLIRTQGSRANEQ